MADAGASPAPVVVEAPPLPPLDPIPEPAPAPVTDVLSRPFITCGGPAKQGGAIFCKTNPGATLSLDGKPIAVADAGGVAIIGLARDQQAPATVGVRLAPSPGATATGGEAYASVDVQPRHDTVSKFEMECKVIAPQSAADKRHAEVSWVKKDNAMHAFSAPLAPLALMKPAVGPYSSEFGVTRTYVPKTKDCEGSTSVHNGQDIAIATGTEIHAPMAGTVLLADPDLFYEGGAVFLDLGRGLVSVTMHMSRIDVKAGDIVGQGQLLGLSGSTGRVTGPHLHWAIKFRNVLSDDRDTDIWLDPMLVLDLKAPN
jgi:murein DD-endopeptidase MepM/ murein hydrolase activator NlpD